MINSSSKNTKGIIALFLVGGVFAFILFKHSGPVSNTAAADLSLVPVVSSAAPSHPITPEAISANSSIPSDYIEYKNDKYHFSFYHSPQSVIHEYDEGGGAGTVTLENLQKVRGLQIFIVPYADTKISEARFKMDVPSGIRTDIQNAVVDGVQAVTFKSHDAFLGDTREVWFIHGGYLYEVTTFSKSATWFVPKMNSWNFI